jgi:threonine dehydratase
MSFTALAGVAATPRLFGSENQALRAPTLRDIYLARQVVNRHLASTPFIFSESLSRILDCTLCIKCENLQPVGAFKVRGGINLLSQLTDEERGRGVVTASTGNHGQSIAYAARLFSTRAIIYVPEGANPLKVASMERLGAEVVFAGVDFDASRIAAESRAFNDDMLFIHSADDARLIAGVGTYALEMLTEQPDIEVIIVPIGAGSGASGVTIVAKTINPAIEVIGVQAAGAPVAHDSWRQRRLLQYDNVATFAEGLATRAAFDLPARILWDQIDDIVLVTDRELKRAMLTLLEQIHMVAEGAGAAALAAAFNERERLRGKKIGIVLSGGNVTLDSLRQAMDEESAW